MKQNGISTSATVPLCGRAINSLRSATADTATLCLQTAIQYSAAHLSAALSALTAPASLEISFVCFGCSSGQRKFNQLKTYTSDASEPSNDCLRSLCALVFLHPTARIATIDSIPPSHSPRSLQCMGQIGRETEPSETLQAS